MENKSYPLNDGIALINDGNMYNYVYCDDLSELKLDKQDYNLKFSKIGIIQFIESINNLNKVYLHKSEKSIFKELIIFVIMLGLFISTFFFKDINVFYEFVIKLVIYIFIVGLIRSFYKNELMLYTLSNKIQQSIQKKDFYNIKNIKLKNSILLFNDINYLYIVVVTNFFIQIFIRINNIYMYIFIKLLVFIFIVELVYRLLIFFDKNDIFLQIPLILISRTLIIQPKNEMYFFAQDILINVFDEKYVNDENYRRGLLLGINDVSQRQRMENTLKKDREEANNENK